ncbi:MAG: Gfo/Idh/MocA family oxidoreductase [Planctomycetia bacterium]|nr:Gfo/Idh/MocA family oxidoreductase [Planctomycetia bacterium]
MKISLNRRRWLQTNLLASTAVASPAWLRHAFGEQAPNSRLRFGGIGMGPRGCSDTGEHMGHAELVAVSDLDSTRMTAANQQFTKGKAAEYSDYRALLDRKDIDVVMIATPDHWHTKTSLDALAAGKHVFCEKPLTLTIRENQILCAAAKKYAKQTFVVGTQRRMEVPRFTRAVNMVRQGLLGEIKHVSVSISKSYNATFAPPKDQRFKLLNVPEGFDWDRWSGQVKVYPYRENRGHGRFRYWYEYAGGRVTDWGAHYLDTVLWALEQDQPGKGLVWVDATDCNHPLPMKDGYPLEDDYYNAAHDFCLKGKLENGVSIELESRLDDCIVFEGTKGRVRVNCGSIRGLPVEENWDKDCYGDDELRALFKGKPKESRMSNFYRCIREGGLPVSDVFSHCQVMTACHVFNIAARLGRNNLRWDPVNETFPEDTQACTFISREQRKGYEIE